MPITFAYGQKMGIFNGEYNDDSLLLTYLHLFRVYSLPSSLEILKNTRVFDTLKFLLRLSDGLKFFFCPTNPYRTTITGNYQTLARLQLLLVMVQLFCNHSYFT